ncbi:unnamed protein product [Toxocara canis]|uniref:mRNA stability protein n=1 Tax=Toxocara canis TaxID=6265 RepID=A0A183UMN3_TOXCA|nr:unnamed protein product [Toxocara canis]
MSKGIKKDVKGSEKITVGETNAEKKQEEILTETLATKGFSSPKAQTVFLQKKLREHRKFFDSGDYAICMDEKRRSSPNRMVRVSASQAKTEPIHRDFTIEEEQLPIPQPDTVPKHKSSIVHPSMRSRLSPQSHLHHNYRSDSSPEP